MTLGLRNQRRAYFVALQCVPGRHWKAAFEAERTALLQRRVFAPPVAECTATPITAP